MTDRIIAYLREHPEGALSKDIAEQFLKFKTPVEKLAHATVAAVLGKDRRCALGPDGFWRAVRTAQPAPTSTRLRDCPLSAVSVLSTNRRLAHVSVWRVFPELQRDASVWLSDPLALAPEEQQSLRSDSDTGFDPLARDERLAQIAHILVERVAVYTGSGEEGLLGWQCTGASASLSDNSILLTHMMRALDLPIPRPLDLSTCALVILGRRPVELAAAQRGKVLAECIEELVGRLEREGIETREQLEAALDTGETAFDFSGKAFSAQTLGALTAGPGVYGFKDSAGTFIYVGKATNVRRRVSGYFRPSDESPTKLERLRADSTDLVVYPCGSELESLIYEHRLIRKYTPRLNTQAEISERKGTYKPIDDCVVLLAAAQAGAGVSVWVRRNQKIMLRPFAGDFSDTEPFAADLESFFFGGSLPAAPTDFPEQEIAHRWLSRHMDELPVVLASRLATGAEILDSMKVLWRQAT